MCKDVAENCIFSASTDFSQRSHAYDKDNQNNISEGCL